MHKEVFHEQSALVQIQQNWGFKRRRARNATLVYLPPADRPQTTLDLGELYRSKEHHEEGNETTKRYQQLNVWGGSIIHK